jgi:hypothetical protein
LPSHVRGYTVGSATSKIPTKSRAETPHKPDRAPRWKVVAGPAANLHPINLAIPLDPDIADRVRRANERAWIDITEIPTPSWPVILVGGSDREHELVRRRHQEAKP